MEEEYEPLKDKTHIQEHCNEPYHFDDELKIAFKGFEHELINEYMDDHIPFIVIHPKKLVALKKKWFPDLLN